MTARARTYAEGEFKVLSSAYLLTSFPPLAKFKYSRFDNQQDLDAFTESFDTGLKVNFTDSSKPHFVRFGSARDNDARCDVKGGKLTLSGWVMPPNAPETEYDRVLPSRKQVEKFFEPSVNTIVENIRHITGGIDPSNIVNIWFLGGSKI